MALHLFGLTGGIGSGKSTVARRFRARGLPVIDADELAREAVAKGSPGLSEIVERFGEGVLDSSGALDRAKLAAVVFANDEARRALNAITHPRVAALSQARAAELDARGEPLACYEVPLLYETRLDALLAPVVVVTVPEAVQVARAVKRDGTTEAEIRARVAAQMPLAEKVRLAAHVIDNGGTIEATLARADDVLDAIARELGVDPARYPKP
ncbi:MAG TPA: dephospho-CoA kinase [Polyangiaceae bacterium]|nr:dephospho-CoA kinase [Polyangiaceae bacterium]